VAFALLARLVVGVPGLCHEALSPPAAVCKPLVVCVPALLAFRPERSRSPLRDEGFRVDRKRQSDRDATTTVETRVGVMSVRSYLT